MLMLIYVFCNFAYVNICKLKIILILLPYPIFIFRQDGFK